MKKPLKVLSALLAIVICFTTMSIGVYANYAYYDTPAGYNSIGDPYISLFQCGTMICDKIDAMLAEKGKTGNISLNVLIEKYDYDYDFTSLNGAISSIVRLRDDELWHDVTSALDLGELESLNVNALRGCPERTVPVSKGGTYPENYNSGHEDIEILYQLFEFLYDNRSILAHIVDGTINLGDLSSSTWQSLISKLKDFTDKLKKIPITIKEAVFKALFDEEEYPAGLTKPDDDNDISGSTVDTMINYYLYGMMFEGIKWGKYRYEKVYAGIDYNVGEAFSARPYALRIDINHNVETVIGNDTYYVQSGEDDYAVAGGSTFAEGVQYYKYCRIENNPWFDNAWDAFAQAYVDAGAISSKSQFGPEIFDINGFSLYNLLCVLRDYAIDEYLVKDPSDEDSLFNKFMDMDDNIIGIVYNLLGFDTTPYSTKEDTVNAFITSLVDFENGCLSNYIRITDQSISLGSGFYDLLSQLLDFASNLVGSLKTYPNIGVYNETELAAYKEAYPSDANTVAYLLKVVANGFLDWCNIPSTYQFGSETRTVSTIPEVLTFAAISFSKDLIPEFDYMSMIKNAQIDPRVLDYKNSSVDSGVLYVGSGLLRFFLNTYTTMSVPANLDFDQTINYIADWVIANFGGVLDTTAIDSTYDGWQKFDWIFFGVKKDGTDVSSAGVIKRNWLYNIEGTYDLIVNHIVCLLNWDFDSFVALFTANNSGELNGSLRTMILNLLKRLFSGMFGGNIIIPANVSCFEDIFTSQNIGQLIYNICTYLKDYDQDLLASVLPLISDSLMEDETSAFSVHLDPNTSLFISYADLINVLDTCNRPSNDGIEYDDPNYQFFGREDFSPAYKYYRFYKSARKDAEEVRDDYEDQAAGNETTFTNYTIADAAYRLYYYYNDLSYNTTLDPTQLSLDIAAANQLYGHATNNSTYTLRTWNEYLRAYNFCEQVYEEVIFSTSNTIRQSKISTARLALTVAIKSLKKYVPLSDYTALNNLIILATNKLNSDAVVNGEYMAESVTALRDALTAAQSVVAMNYDSDDQEIVDDAYTVLYNAMNLTYIPAIAKVEGTTTTIDKTSNTIYGLTPGFTNYFSYIDVHGAGTLNQYTNSNGGIGTGAKVELVVGTGDDAQIISSYTIVVYGDIDGDASVDATDANILYWYFCNYLNYANNAEGQAFRMASDVNNDSTVDINDVYFLIRAGLCDSNYVVSQRGTV